MAKAELVILSVCTTLGSSVAASENSLGLSGIIAQSTGAAVLHTIWPVDDEIARDLVSTFVEAFLGTRDPASALAESRLRIQSRYGSDPAVAEGFTVFG